MGIWLSYRIKNNDLERTLFLSHQHWAPLLRQTRTLHSPGCLPGFLLLIVYPPGDVGVVLLNEVLEGGLASEEREEDTQAVDVEVGAEGVGAGVMGLGDMVEEEGRDGEVVILIGGGEGGDKAVVVEAGLSLLDGIVVEAAIEAVVTGDDDEGDLLDGVDLGEGDVNVLVLELLADIVKDLDDGLREGAATDDGLLSAWRTLSVAASFMALVIYV
ncbi:hypothetical protein COCNU_07G002070 [Cocos nucifera]|uniref:Uncharacterized protein n=1 Tax=Cocos nucifera TaxID=13894 RepID=A0A8K0N3X4_COCNU|nr:hypothetical protein COCNU_07G002070 [Cocos nucifera]